MRVLAISILALFSYFHVCFIGNRPCKFVGTSTSGSRVPGAEVSKYVLASGLASNPKAAHLKSS